MILCILAADEHVEAVRAKAVENIPELVGHRLLSIPVSATGESPPTHWFCSFTVTQEQLDALLALREHSTMEVSKPFSFLAAHELKIVHKK